MITGAAKCRLLGFHACENSPLPVDHSRAPLAFLELKAVGGISLWRVVGAVDAYDNPIRLLKTGRLYLLSPSVSGNVFLSVLDVLLR